MKTIIWSTLGNFNESLFNLFVVKDTIFEKHVALQKMKILRCTSFTWTFWSHW